MRALTKAGERDWPRRLRRRKARAGAASRPDIQTEVGTPLESVVLRVDREALAAGKRSLRERADAARKELHRL